MHPFDLRNTHPLYRIALVALLVLALACVVEDPEDSNRENANYENDVTEGDDVAEGNNHQTNNDETNNDETNNDETNNDGSPEATANCIAESRTEETCNVAGDCPELICVCEDDDESMGRGCGGPDGSFCMSPTLCEGLCGSLGGWTGECYAAEE